MTPKARTHRFVPSRLLAGSAMGLILTVSGCGSDAKTATTTAPAAAAASTTAAAAASTTSGGVATTDAVGTTPATSGGARLDLCASTAPDTVAASFISSINYAGADTFMQCVYKDTVAESVGTAIKLKNFSSLSPSIDAATNTYVYATPDGSKLTVRLTKEANGKFYVTAATLG